MWAFFKTFQEEMKNRVRTKDIVEKYKETICFMVNKDECMKEVVQRRIVWIMPIGYEVDVVTLDGYAQHLLTTPVDEKEEKFGTAQEKGLKVDQEQVAPNITRKMKRFAVEQLISEGHDRAKVE